MKHNGDHSESRGSKASLFSFPYASGSIKSIPATTMVSDARHAHSMHAHACAGMLMHLGIFAFLHLWMLLDRYGPR